VTSAPRPEASGAAPGPTRSTPWWGLDLLDNRFAALHGLRVFAIVSVVQYHVTWVLDEERVKLDRDFIDASLRLFFGMDLFFVLSGFLIGSILLRSLDTTGTLDVWRFYLRRIFRTFPPYYVVLAYLAWVTPLTDQQRHNLPAEILYATNFVSMAPTHVVMFWGWSLALEEQFYLVVPGLFWVLTKFATDRARVAFLSVLALGALGRRLWMLYRMGPWSDTWLYVNLYFRTPTRYDALVWGIVMAIAVQRWGDRIRDFLATPRHRALVAIPSIALMWLVYTPDLFGRGPEQLVKVLSWGTLTSAMYFGFVPLLLQGEGLFARFFSAHVFRQIATLGYGIYLVHIPLCYGLLVPMARALVARHWSMVVVWPLGLAVVLVTSAIIAYVLHVLVEKPSLRLRQAITG
jgi:peptidoglycan/LPS O-acetylase OafA/YrhL